MSIIEEETNSVEEQVIKERNLFILNKSLDIKKTIAKIMKLPMEHCDVEDVFQNTMLEILKDSVWKSFEARNKAARFTWTIGVAKKVMLRFWEKRQKYTDRLNSIEEMYKEQSNIKRGGLTLENLSVEQEEIFGAFLEYLPDIFHSTLIFKLQGYTYKEIGKILNIPLTTAAARITYVKEYIKRFQKEIS